MEYFTSIWKAQVPSSEKKNFTYYHLQFVLEQGSLRGAYVQDKNISARLCAKKAGGLMREGGGGIFVGHYGIQIHRLSEPMVQS